MMKKGIMHILVANIIYLLINILNSFLLPKFLSVNTYAIMKTYTLYIGYAGFLSLGYADGMYLKYGGDSLMQIKQDDLSSNYKSYLILEAVVCILCFGIAFFLQNFVFGCFALGCFFVNMIGYYKNLYQAVGEYKLYGQALNSQTILLFLMNMILLFVFRIDNSRIYILVQILSAVVVMFYLTLKLNQRINLLKTGRGSLHAIWDNVKLGFTLMLGNFSSSIFTGLDRWFIKFLMADHFFAYYSFAVSLENIVNVFVTPITVSLYNTFCHKHSTQYVMKIKRLTLMWGFIVIAAAYPVKFIIVHFLSKYMAALSIIYLLFATQAFYAVIKGIYVNLYKAEHRQNHYFKVMAVMIMLAIVLNGCFYKVFCSVEAFALATFVTALVWSIYCEFEAKELRFRIREYIAIIALLSVYFYTGQMQNSVIGLCTYLVGYCVICSFCMKETVQDAVKILISFIKIKRS